MQAKIIGSVAVFLSLGLGANTFALADEALAKQKNCMACHTIEKKLVGPSYKDVAKKYAGQAKSADMLAAKIMKGGSGVWGAIPMPSNPQVNQQEATTLAKWVLSLK